MRVLNKRRDPIPPGAVYIGRGSKWGNPFKLTTEADRPRVIARYREHLAEQVRAGTVTMDELRELKDRPLVCFCKPKPCHGDVLAQAVEWALGQRPTPPWEAVLADPAGGPSRQAFSVYAGIGSRNIPGHAAQLFLKTAKALAGKGVLMRSGGAIGADQSFYLGAGPDHTQLYLPWAGYNGHQGAHVHVMSDQENQAARALVADLHPAWEQCSRAARTLHARNAQILLGPTFDDPVQQVLCYTEGGALKGGTAMGIRIAEQHRIPVLNLGAFPSVKWESVLQEFVDVGQALPAAAPSPPDPPMLS